MEGDTDIKEKDEKDSEEKVAVINRGGRDSANKKSERRRNKKEEG